MSIYHMKVSVGSRGGGQSACAKSDYVSREGKYAPDSPDEDDLEHLEHGNMPAWAEDDPRALLVGGGRARARQRLAVQRGAGCAAGGAQTQTSGASWP